MLALYYHRRMKGFVDCRFYGTTLLLGILCGICKAALTPVDPRFSLPRPPFSASSQESTHTQQLPVYNRPSSKEWNMSQNNITNLSNNTNSFNVQNINVVADDRSQILTWLSPLEPRLRHRDIQGRRVDNVGEWLLQTEEFRTWSDCGEGGESDKAVLFCYGGPGVGKTFIR